MKFAHIADTHIRNLKYHYEYKAVFEKLYEHLRAEKVDYIIHCGDIAHTKTQISPEFVEMCAKLKSDAIFIACVPFPAPGGPKKTTKWVNQ